MDRCHRTVAMFVLLSWILIWGCKSNSTDKTSDTPEPKQTEMAVQPADVIDQAEIERILYAYRGSKTYISKFGSIAAFQAALIATCVCTGAKYLALFFLLNIT